MIETTADPGLDWSRALDLVGCPDGPVRLAFQPIADLRRGVVAGYEVLARFDLDGYPPYPLPWLAAAEREHRLGDLERAILAKALRVRPQLPANTFLSVNVSAGVMLETATSEVLAAGGDLRGLVVEITEHERVLDYDALRTAFASTASAGALLGVDDVGAGYASLGHVLALRPAFVKLDRALVTDLDHEPHRRAAVAAIGALTDELDGWLVAEGIERRGELEVVAELEVALGQGYLLGRPGPEAGDLAPEVADLVRHLGDHEHVALPVGRLVRETPMREVDDAEMRAVMRTANGRRSLTGERSHVVLVDDHGAPVGLEVDGELVPGGPRPMCVMPGEDVADVALRAAGRPASERLLPVVCCDALGRAIGVVGVERLTEALARSRTSG
ncbi:EAL domain-containing protein [Patulibacter minatonensis]|uniref:EAL domain-containing protein n=1 Tax=Patulibacter minatonensis TaxID=298163 RepID=UPI0006875B45|nr:EAL domain-containing protein [Patulibacter minatonensis]